MTRTACIITELSSINPAEWQVLDHQHNPFISYAFLQALEASGSVAQAVGWQPHHLCLYENDQLVAVAPSYLKSHSHGEFVFDWAWADAYQRYGRKYYPKLLTAVPYSPVAGPRLLVKRDHPDALTLRQELVDLAMSQCDTLDLSSWHCNFIGPLDIAAMQNTSLLARSDWQFHWFNQGYRSFDDFLAALRSKKRKNIRRERRQVSATGIRFIHKSGSQLETGDMEFIHACYQQTFFEHGNHPALNLAFFTLLVHSFPEAVLVVMAMRGDERLAMSLYLVGGGRLYGRYWGCLEHIPDLHFETAYYQGIEYCIEHGLQVFEPGAQGEHKISRGFTPVKTHSFHLVRDPDFHTAIAAHLQKEQVWQQEYRQQLATHEPFRLDKPL